jgi:hypothetical protein
MNRRQRRLRQKVWANLQSNLIEFYKARRSDSQAARRAKRL